MTGCTCHAPSAFHTSGRNGSREILQFFDGRQQSISAYHGRDQATSTSTDGGAAKPYVYDETGRLVENTGAQRRQVNYDAWGRAVSTRIYEGERLVSQGEYRYDPLGRKVWEMQSYGVGKPVTRLFYDLDGNVIQENVFVVGQSIVTHARDHVFSPVGEGLRHTGILGTF